MVRESPHSQAQTRLSWDNARALRVYPRSEVLQLIAEGKNMKQIGHLLGISSKTAEVHRGQLMDRLDIHDVAGLVRYAIRTGLVSAEK